MHVWFTYGPSTDNTGILEQMLLAGANGCRLTFSYGTCRLQKERAERLKQVAEAVNKPCLVIADLAGGKIRLGDFALSAIEIKAGEPVSFGTPDVQTDLSANLFSITSTIPFEQAELGEVIVIGDGSLILTITSIEPTIIRAIATENGVVNPNRGFTIRGSSFCPPCLTSKDIDDLKFIVQSRVFDMVALSFVSDVSQIVQAREIMQKTGRVLPIIAKIETPSGLINLTSIAREADFIMAARGDLALTMDWLELPTVVDTIQQVCSSVGRPWLLATQIMEGLERFAFPTRAEICDLTFWLRKGVAGVLLSYETAFGKKPVEAAAASYKICERWGIA